MSPAIELVGRETECESIHDFVRSVGDGPGALMLIGEPGMGKTTLWTEGVDVAEASGFTVLRSRPAEAEIALPFAALGDLLGDVEESVLAKLPTPQHTALDVALLRTEPEPGSSEGHAVALGVLGVLRTLAETAPVVIAVDDVQWLDQPSVDALAFVIRRLRGETVGLLLARRSEGAGSPLESAVAPGRLTRLEVGPLAASAIDKLLLARLDRQFPRPALAELQRVSGGNPFFALELGRALPPESAAGETLPVPATLSELVRDRLSALPEPARRAALAVSALSRPTVALVEAAAASGLDGAVAAGVLELDDDRLRFTHPLLGSALYSELPSSERRELHARLAELVDDPDERVGHLALAASGPDAEVAAALDGAAHRTRVRGAPQAAAALWERARALTPDEDLGRWRRAVEAAECHIEAGNTQRARTLLEDVVISLPPGHDRAIAMMRLAWARAFRAGFQVAVGLFRTALEEIGDDDAARIEIQRGLAWSIHEIGDVRGAEPHARAALELAERLGDPGLLASSLADLAFLETILGRGVPTAMVARALELEGDDHWQPFLGRVGPQWVNGALQMWSGDLDGARSTFASLRESVLARGDDHSLGYVAFQHARVECLAGNWEIAARFAAECAELTAQTGQNEERPFALLIGAWVDAHLGNVDAARAATDEALPLALELGVVPAHLETLAVRGFLEHSLGDAKQARRFLGPLPRAVADAGFGEPALFRFHGDAIENLLALGEQERAAALLAELEEQAAATGGRWAAVVAARSRGLLHAAAGELDAADDDLRRAIELQQELHEPFERARTLLVHGTIERRSRKRSAARDSLERARAAFDKLGAPLWSAKVDVELARIGGRAAAPGTLTPTEERIAELVASGRTYREVADALFISPKTVQWNLSKIYRKLGVGSRAELVAKLASAGASQTPAEPPVQA